MGKSRMLKLLCILIFFISSSVSAEEISLERMMMLHDLEAIPDVQKNDVSDQKHPNEDASIISISDVQKPLRLLIDVRSDHSDGKHDFDTLIQLAESRAIEAMVFTEHERYTIRFGIDPVPYLFGYSQEHPSLYETGVEKFFTDLNEAQKKTEITLFAGTESTPGYYWEGIPFKDLSLHQAEKHLITLGVDDASQIEALPSYDLKHAYGNKNLSLMFWFIFVFLFIFRLLRKRKRSVALLLAGSFIAFMASWQLKPQVDPYEDFILKSQEQDLFVIWTHPGTLSGVREGPMGVWLNTPPYNEAIFEKPADAFAAIYGDTDNNTKPSGLWDQYMMQYLQGYKAKPIWAVSAGDYHEQGMANEYLGNYPMDVWAKSKSEQDILQALRQGRMVSWQMQKNQNIATSALFLEFNDPDTFEKKRIYSGDEAVVPARLQAVAAVHNLKSTDSPLQLKGHWVVDGVVTSEATLSTENADAVTATVLDLPKGHHVVRFQIPSQQGIRMESNPFLLQVR